MKTPVSPLASQAAVISAFSGSLLLFLAATLLFFSLPGQRAGIVYLVPVLYFLSLVLLTLLLIRGGVSRQESAAVSAAAVCSRETRVIPTC